MRATHLPLTLIGRSRAFYAKASPLPLKINLILHQLDDRIVLWVYCSRTFVLVKNKFLVMRNSLLWEMRLLGRSFVQVVRLGTNHVWKACAKRV